MTPTSLNDFTSVPRGMIAMRSIVQDNHLDNKKEQGYFRKKQIFKKTLL